MKTKSGNLRNAEKEQLAAYLNVEPGSVTPLALINLNEKGKTEVEFLLDNSITTPYIAIHPMINTSTIFLKKEDLISLLNKEGIKVSPIDLEINEATSEEKQTENNTKDQKNIKTQKENKNKAKVDESEADKEMHELQIKAKKDVDFPSWYSEVIVKSEMIEYYEISGCYVLRPWSYQIWEFIQKFFDEKIKELEVENVYFPLFVSERALNKEKDHIAGFSPEVAWVTKSGSSNLENPIAIRPTSETIMYPSFKNWIRSHRDLPVRVNQWTNVVRWEFKNPTPFIRTREFLWQEGHTAHATSEEAETQVFQILDLYRQIYEDLLAVPVIPGRKSDNEKFAGGMYTTTIETMVPTNGRAIQCATSHHLGQNFSKMFEITFLDKDKQKKFAWQTSWGCTTRTIGVMVMIHGDDQGLVLPPRVAPIQVVMVPIIKSKDDPTEINNKLKEFSKLLKAKNIRNKIDDNDVHNPGFKFNHWERKGVPIRLEFGKLDLQAGHVTLVLRDNKEKLTVKYEDLASKVAQLLEEMQARMLNKARNTLNAQRKNANDFSTLLKLISEKNMVQTAWCNKISCEEDVKKQVKIESEKAGLDESVAGSAKTLCIPLTQDPIPEGTKCFFCANKAEVYAIWGRSY